MRLQDFMSTNVMTVKPNDSAQEAWNLMRTRDIYHLVVMDGSEVVGIISHRDLGGNNGTSTLKGKTVADLMTPHIITATPDTTVREAANRLRGNSIGCLPVIEKGRLMGIVTVTDILDLLGHGIERIKPLQERKPVRGIPPQPEDVHSLAISNAQKGF